MNKSIPLGITIKEGMTVSVRKSKIGENSMVLLGEGKIEQVSDNKISIYIPFLENQIEDADKIKLFWEDGKYYFCGTSSMFYPHHTQFDHLTLEGLEKIYSIEKRKHIRLSHNLGIDYKWVSSPECVCEFCTKGIHSGLGINLSCGGMEFITNERLGVDDMIEVGFEFPSFSSYMIFAKGRIVRVSKSSDPDMSYKVAIQFTDIDSQDKRLIGEFILEELSGISGDSN